MTGPNDAVRAHRTDYWAWIEANAVDPEREALLRLRDHWRKVNAEHFDGAMGLPYITLTQPSKPSILGQCCPVSSWGSRLEIKIRPSLVYGTHPAMGEPTEGRLRFVEDVLLHEVIHQHAIEVTGKTEPSYHGHGPAFCEHANRIGDGLGLPPVVPRNRGGSKNPTASQWPHRDDAYYLGAYLGRNVKADASPQPDEPCPHCAGTGRAPKTPADLPELAEPSRETPRAVVDLAERLGLPVERVLSMSQRELLAARANLALGRTIA